MNSPDDSTKRRTSIAFGIGVIFGGVLCYFYAADTLQIQTLISRDEELRDLLDQQPTLVLLTAFLMYSIATGLSIPGAAILSLALGWYLGFTRALILVSFASTSGATLAFLSSRYLLRERIMKRYSDKLSRVNHHLEHDGAFYLFTLRLVPAIPFFLINLLMGLTPMRVRTFWWVSQIGMLPGTIAYVYAGSNLPDLATITSSNRPAILTPQLVVAFIILGFLPWIGRRMVKIIQKPNRT
ncbi:MAG: TVP38/TMEM64 family protein [Planctomycetota bacterium]|nr:TVP38/TMEM64 family protein [Planctomycetota bacterium]